MSMWHETLTPEQVEDLIAAAEENGLEVRPYSGRGMYGRECVGIVVDEPFADLIKLLGVLVDGARDSDEARDIFAALAYVQRDSMGLGTVLYWPKIAWPEDRPETTLQDAASDAEAQEYALSHLNLQAALAASVTGDPEVVDVDLHHG